MDLKKTTEYLNEQIMMIKDGSTKPLISKSLAILIKKEFFVLTVSVVPLTMRQGAPWLSGKGTFSTAFLLHSALMSSVNWELLGAALNCAAAQRRRCARECFNLTPAHHLCSVYKMCAACTAAILDPRSARRRVGCLLCAYLIQSLLRYKKKRHQECRGLMSDITICGLANYYT